jgi:pimeloyl-ACP methyl ester carboxylesterase
MSETIYNSPGKLAHKHIIADGYRTHYIEAGSPEAPPLVLVHGAGMEIGLGVDRWYPVVVPLAERFHVFAVDEIGHGDTDPPRDLHDLAHVRVRADHIIAFIDALGVGPVNILGQSQGGWIVTYVTLRRPDLVRNLVLVDSGSVSGSEAAPQQLAYYATDGMYEPGTRIPRRNLKLPENIRAHFETFVHDKAAVTDELVEHLVPLAAKWNDRYMDHTREVWRDGTAAGTQTEYAMYCVDGVHISEHVSTLQRPALLVWGKQTVKSLDSGIDLYKRVPNAQMHIFDRANHFLWLDQPRDFTGLVSWFLTRD